LKSKSAGILLVIVFVLSACAAKVPPSSSYQIEAMAVNVETVLKVQPEADECLACHSDKDRLIETAKPEEVVEKESSGAG